MGLDLARLQAPPDGFDPQTFDPAERALLDGFGPQCPEAALRFWCAKRALGKALGAGEAPSLRAARVRWADARADELHVEAGPDLHPALPPDRPVRYRIRTACHDGLVVATTLREQVAGP